MLAVKVVETKDHLKSAINLVNQKVRMQHLVEFQLLEFAILYKAAAFSVCSYVRTLHPTVRPRFLRRSPLCDEQYTNSCQGIVFVKLENHAKIFCKKIPAAYGILIQSAYSFVYLLELFEQC